MDFALLGVFILVCGAAMVHLCIYPQRLFEYPLAISAVFAAVVAPQLLVIAERLDRIPVDSFALLVGMSTLCMLACWAGYATRPSAPLTRWFRFPLDERRLFQGGLLLLAIGTMSHIMCAESAELAENRSNIGTITGTASIWFFVGQCQPIGFGIVMMSAVRRPTVVTVGAAAMGLWSPVIAAVFFGRRESTALSVMIVLLSFYFRRGVSPPRWIVIVGILAAGILIPIASEYRTSAKQEGLGVLTNFDAVGKFKEAQSSGKTAPELTLAAYVIAHTSETGEYGYGRGYWNTMVFRFVPAQIVGRDIKEALMIRNERQTAMVLKRSSAVSIGTTCTGVGDAFQEYSYFGCLVFASMGALFRNLWEAARRYGSLPAQLLYMQTLTVAMRALTHQTSDFLPGLVYNVLFLGAVCLFARVHVEEPV